MTTDNEKHKRNVYIILRNMMDTVQQDIEQPLEKNSNKINKYVPPRWISQNCVIVSIVLTVLVIFIPLIIVSFVRNGKNDNNINIDDATSTMKLLWHDISPSTTLLSQQFEHITHIQLIGASSEKLVIAGTDLTNTNTASRIEIYKYNNNDNKEKWDIVTGITALPQDFHITSMAVSLYGLRIVLCAINPIRFVVYDNTEGDTWEQYGEVLFVSDLINGTTILDKDDAGHFNQSPNIMLSDDGRTMAISVPPSNNNGGSVHVLTDVNTLNGNIGTFWKPKGLPILQGTSSSIITKHTAMDGDGQSVVIASYEGVMSLHKWSETDGFWHLVAEYDESPLPSSGSLALSKDGSTIAVGSYKGVVDGSGELLILNDVWPWYMYNDEKPWLIEGTDGPDYNHNATSVQVSLSKKGDIVLVGRKSYTNDQSKHDVSLQVYQYNTKKTEWTCTGQPFGQITTNTMAKNNNDNDMMMTDLSDDGTKIAALIMGKVYVYKSIH